MKKEEFAFLEKICEAPENDAPRLVFADWLEENDQLKFAKFIRGQIELATMDEADPRYPALLAEIRRSGMFTEPRRQPFVDHVPNAKVMFRRGLIAGVEVTIPSLVSHPTEAWSRVPIEQLALSARVRTEGGSREITTEELQALCQRPELARVRTLCLTDHWSFEQLYDLWNDCPHLSGLKALSVKLGGGFRDDTDYDEMERTILSPFPSLDSLKIYDEFLPVRWEPILKAVPKNLRRLYLSAHESYDQDMWADEAFDCVPRTITTSTLAQGTLLIERDRWDNDDPDPRVFDIHQLEKITKTKLEHLGIHEHDVSRLPQRKWGNVKSLELVESDDSDPPVGLLARTPASNQLETLTVWSRIREEGARELADGKYLQNLRRLLLTCCHHEFLGGHYCQQLLKLRWFGEGRGIDSEPENDPLPHEQYERGRLRPRLTIDDLERLAATPFPNLRTLQLGGVRKLEDLEPLLASKNFPNLCTLQLFRSNYAHPPSDWFEEIAKAPHMPHLSLAGHRFSDNWVIENGQAKMVLRDVFPIERDWWQLLQFH